MGNRTQKNVVEIRLEQRYDFVGTNRQRDNHVN